MKLPPYLPLLVMPGTSGYVLGTGDRRTVLFAVDLLAQSVLLAWLYDGAGRTTLVAVAFHLATVMTGETFVLAGSRPLHRVGWTVAAAALVVLYAGPRTLVRRRPARRPARSTLRAGALRPAPGPAP